MTLTAKPLDFKRLPTDYSRLIGLLPLRPLRDSADLENATEILDAMAGHELTRDQEDYLDVLSDLVARYEAEHHPARAPAISPLQRLRYLMAESGMKTTDLGRLLGNRGLASLILHGKRSLSKSHIRKLAEHFRLEAGYFL